MSDTDFSKLLTRLATLEAEVSGYRKTAPATPSGLDPNQLRQRMIADPAGTLAQLGIPTDHITKLLVATAMGDSAPQELKMLAAMGPQVNATQALQAKMEELAGKLSSIDASRNKQSTRESFKAFTADKSKYPHLAKAYAADSSLFDEDLDAHGGSAEELASKLEARHARFAKAHGVPVASDESATTDVQSEQDKPASSAGALSGNPPPLPTRKASGVMTADEDKALQAEIIKKYTQGATA